MQFSVGRLLAQEFGCSSQTVAKYLKANGLKVTRQKHESTQDQVEEDDLPIDEPALPLAITFPARLDFTPLDPDDWSDIQGLLTQGRSREAIASDYDVPVEYLDGFIAERLREGEERRAAKGVPSGEA